MTSKNPPHYPISKVYIVSDPQKCSPNDELLLKSKDKDSDCDLLREGGVFKRNTRYLCFSRAFQKESLDSTVVVAITLISERESPSADFFTIEKTADSGERATKKKLLCFKTANRSSAKEALCDIRLYTKMKRPEPGYTAIGELNGVFICTKSQPIPAEAVPFKHASPHQGNVLRPAPPPPSHKKPVPVSRTKTDYSTLNPLSNVDFKLTSESPLHSTKSSFKPATSFRSLNDIENEFGYNFNLERSVLSK